MPFPNPEIAARLASMSQEQFARQKMVRSVNVPGAQGPDEILPAPTLAQGGFDIEHPYLGTEQVAYKDPASGKVSLVKAGEYRMVPEAEAQSYADNGWQVESPQDYWSRQENERREGATGQAFMGAAVSGLTFGASDAIMREQYGPSAIRMEEDIRARHPTASTVGEVAGMAASMVLPVEPIGAVMGKALSAGARAGSYGGRFIGMSRKAEQAAELAAKAARKSAASELALYKNLPATEAEKVALKAQLAADEARVASVRGVDTAFEPVTATGVARTAEGGIPMGAGTPFSSPSYTPPASSRLLGTGEGTAAERAAAGLADDAVSPLAAGEQAAAKVVDDALVPAQAGGEVGWVERPGMPELWGKVTNYKKGTSLEVKQFKSAVDDLKLPAEDAEDFVLLLKAQRKSESAAKWARDVLAKATKQGKPMGEKQHRALLHKMKDAADDLAEVYARRAARGHQMPPGDPTAQTIIPSFFQAPPVRPALKAATGEVKAATTAAKATRAEAPSLSLADDALEAYPMRRGTDSAIRGETAMVPAGRRGETALARAEAKGGVPAVSRAQVKREVIDVLHEQIERAVAGRTMPDFLRSSSAWPKVPRYTKAGGEAWAAGRGASKAPTSRIVDGKWDPGADWTVGRGAPRFPTGQAAEVAAPRAEAILRSLSTTATRGAVEGGSFAAGREFSRQALSGEDYDAGDVAVHAIQGAALGSLVSLAGAGLSSVAGRGAAKLKETVLSRAGVDTSRLDILLARERLVRARLRHLGEDPGKQAYVSHLRAIRKEVFNERARVFETSGQLLKGMAGPLGIGTGLGSGSLVGMLLGHAGAHAAAKVLSSGVVKRAGVAVGRAALATGRAAKVPGKALAKGAGLAVVGTLTAEEVEALKVQLEQTDVKDVALAAVKGYQAAGLDQGMTRFLADFQSRRVDLLKMAVENAGKSSTGRVVASRVHRAVSDPAGITKRLEAGDVHTEDLLVLQNLFPSFYRDLSKQAGELLKRPELSARQRLDLMKIAGNASYPITTNAIQTAIAPQQQEEQPGRRSTQKVTNDAATESQRIQGGS